MKTLHTQARCSTAISVGAGNVTQRVVGPLANGVYSWTVSSYDGVGNSSANASVRTFTVDKRLVINPNQTSSTTLTSSDGFTPTISVPAGLIALTGTLEMSYQPLPTEESPAPPEGGLLLGFSLDLLQDGAVQSAWSSANPSPSPSPTTARSVSDRSTLQILGPGCQQRVVKRWHHNHHPRSAIR